MSEQGKQDRVRWLDHAGNVRKIYRWVWIASALLLIGGEGLLVWARGRAENHGGHSGFSFESWPGFFALFGFVACVGLVLAAKELRKLVMRPEDYYEPTDVVSDDEALDGD